MPFRNLRTLELWVEEFEQLGHPLDGQVRVIAQDGAAGANTGLVGVQLGNATTGAFIQPVSADGTAWVVTFEPREEPVTLSPAEVLALVRELETVSLLCQYLQDRSRSYTGIDGV
jgi:hypothetical protein